MLLSANIGHVIDPVERKSFRAMIATRFLSFAQSIRDRVLSNLVIELDHSIYALEGIISRVGEVREEHLQNMIESNKAAIVDFDKLSSSAAEMDYFGSEEVMEKIKYIQKCLYKIDAKLHRRTYRLKSTIKTDEELKNNLSKLNCIQSN